MKRRTSRRPSNSSCASAGRNLAKRKSTRAGKQLRACRPNPAAKRAPARLFSVFYDDPDADGSLYAQVSARSAADARHAFHLAMQDQNDVTITRVVEGAPTAAQKRGAMFVGRFANAARRGST